MFKNTKKKDLIIVAEAIGEVVPEKTNIVKLKQIIENSQAAKDDLEFVKDIIISTVEEREKIEAEERGKIEAERAREEAERAREEAEKAREKERQFELEKLKLTLAHEESMRNVQATGISSPNGPPQENHAESIEQIIKSIRTLTMPIPTKSENFNLFFNILERAFETKQVKTEYKAEVLLNLLGEKCRHVLLYANESEIKDYDEIKRIVLREFQPSAKECWDNFQAAKRFKGENHVQFVSRLKANLEYYLELRKVKDFATLCELIVTDKLTSTLDKDTSEHILIKQGSDWLKPLMLAKEIDIYFRARNKSLFWEESRYTHDYSSRPRVNNSRQNNDHVHGGNIDRKTCFKCNSTSHLIKFCPQNVDARQHNNQGRSHNSNPVNSMLKSNEIPQELIIAELEYADIIVNDVPIKALVDSGSVLMIINPKYVKKLNYVGRSTKIKLANSSIVSLPLVAIDISHVNKKSVTKRVLAAVDTNISFECILPSNSYLDLKNTFPNKNDNNSTSPINENKKDFDYEIVHRSGSQMRHVDSLRDKPNSHDCTL
ncbi:hypothetical protein HNY73_001980 [Argiope bruennichi]|uniref:CCHC-type domain-containing protein n=1 Tax=Argiope bruennichi TaxID=94029 RepID=A0A8T0FS89_ARGBR|nr:hypothetical protein HNY73_001980 [Argiope bruennichi]